VRRSCRAQSRRYDDRGTAAVEFAILIPLMCSLLFGIIDYGLFFNESLNVRQAVRESARRGVVQDFGSPVTAQGLANYTATEVGAVAGTAYARVEVPGAWQRGEPVLVCAMVDVNDALIDFVPLPLPSGGVVKSQTRMSIEVETTTVASGSSAQTGGSDWSWCD